MVSLRLAKYIYILIPLILVNMNSKSIFYFIFFMSLVYSQFFLPLDGVPALEGVLLYNNTDLGSENSSLLNNSLISDLNLDSPKIDDYLKTNANSLIDTKVSVIIQTNKKISDNERNQLLDLGSEIKYEYSIIDGAALTTDTIKLDDLAELSFVKTVEFDADTKIVLATSTVQTGVARVWLDFGANGTGVKIAVLDTGIDDEHPDLQNVILEQDFTGEGTDDDHGHGTHVASTIAGSGKLSAGANKGVAYGASLMDVKVLNKLGTGKLSDTIAGIQYSVLSGADIISMSLGSDIPCNGLDATSLASDAAVASGVQVVVAAGNSGPLPGTVGSPGCAKEVITVGAVDQFDNIAVFSSRGPTLDERTKPDIMAPGILILAAQAGGAYTTKSGTSMATPHVSGVIALILEKNPNLSPSQIKSTLKRTALDLGQDENSQGSGRIQAYDAFLEATGLEPPPQNYSNGNETYNETNPDEKQDDQSDTQKDNTNQETSEPPQEQKITKEEAIEKSKDQENLTTIISVDEKEDKGNSYYVVEGERENDKSQNETVFVWVNQDTGAIEKIQRPSAFDSLVSWIVKFFLWVIELVKGFFSWIGSLFEK